MTVALLLVAGCVGTGEDAVRELGKTGASTVAAVQSNLDIATQGMQAGLERHGQRLGSAAGAIDAASLPHTGALLDQLAEVRTTRSEALRRLQETYQAFREIEDKHDPVTFAQAAGAAESRFEQWRRAVRALSGDVSDPAVPPLPTPQHSIWRPLRMLLGEPLRTDARQASARLRLMLVAGTVILEAERDGVVAMQRATSQLRFSNDLALWRADQLDLSPLAAHAAGNKPQFLRDAARKQMKPGTAHGREFTERRLAEYLDDEDRALRLVYNAAIKALAKLQAAHEALAGEADLNLGGVKRAVQQMARATQTFEGAP